MSKSSPSTAEVLRAGLLAFAGIVLLWALSDLVLVVFAAVLLSVLLRGAAGMLSRVTGLRVNSSLAIVTVFIVGGAALFAILLGPRFLAEGKQLVHEVVQYVTRMQQNSSGTLFGNILNSAISMKKGAAVGPLAPKLLSVTFGTAGGLVLILVTALYLAVSPRLYTEGLVRLVPLFYRARARLIFAEVTHVLRYWMLGQLVDMAVVGILSTVGLLILGVPLPIALGVIAGLLTFIPYVGAILAGIPAIIVASTMGLTTVLWVVALYTACHVIEGYLVAPLVTRRTVDLPPALTVLSMSVLGTLYGFFGVLIATPLTAAVIVLIREVYVHDLLGDEARPVEPFVKHQN
jgi:predicted PurR-regulated permease PerM